MQIIRNGSKPSLQGTDAHFTGTVRIETLFHVDDPSHITGGVVTFEPGARTHWHTHPAGQALYVLSGVGWTQCEGSPRTEIRAGDVVTCPCNRRHWHGASDSFPMAHLAITEKLNGEVVKWMEPVTDAQYHDGELVKA